MSSNETTNGSIITSYATAPTRTITAGGATYAYRELGPKGGHPHPRVAMQILRHSQIAVTMDIYSQVASASTREALSKLGSRLGSEV